MASSIIKYLGGAITMFALCLIGTATAAPNGNGDEKDKTPAEKKETSTQNHQWFIFNGSTPEEESDASLYVPYTGTEEPSDCNGTELNCAIFAVPDATNPNRPDLDQVDESQTMKQPLPNK